MLNDLTTKLITSPPSATPITNFLMDDKDHSSMPNNLHSQQPLKTHLLEGSEITTQLWSSLHWRTYRNWQRDQWNPMTQDWLLDRGSLTKRLIEASQDQFSVACLWEGWKKPLLHEQQQLNLRSQESAFIRMVALKGRDQVWVLARSVIPRTTLQGSLRVLCHLGNRPLGAFLFSQPHFKRSHLQIGRPHLLKMTKPGSRPKSIHESIHESTQDGWARRSVFTLHQRHQKPQSLLVSELFLPQLFQSIREQHCQ